MPGVHVRCPVPPSGIRLSRIGVHLSAPVSSWSALVRRAVTRLGTGRVGVPPIVSATGSSVARVQPGAWSWRRPRWQRRHPPGPGSRRGRRVSGGLIRPPGRQGAAGCAPGSPSVRRAAGAREVRPPAAGCAQVGWSRMPACGRARLGRGSPGTGGPWPDSAECARPRRGPRQHAVPQKQSDREGNPV